MEQFMKEIPKLGFGLMRLPRVNDEMDIEQIKKMVDVFLENGLKYFDTAYVYDKSEETTKIALVDRYPRDAYYLTSKLNASPSVAPTAEEAKAELKTSLERTGAGYFDFYLLHAISDNNIEYYDKFGIWDFVKEAKEEGLIKHYGFSFHGTPELLDRLLTEHPDVDVVQLQINYADMDDPNVQSRRNHEIVVKHDKPIIIMEPVKGGNLANLKPQIQELFKAANPDASAASWAIRFAASLDNVMVVLSGMSTLEQVQDNVSYMKDFKPLTDDEQMIIEQAQAIIKGIDNIPCTACHYCTEGCPMQIPIPELFSAMNRYLVYDNLQGAIDHYNFATNNRGVASSCIHCQQCENACPQHIEITSWLEKIAEVLESK